MARLPLLTPRTITYDQSLPAKNLPFPPCGRRVSPIQAASCHLQSGHGECLPATQLYLSVFTCPTVSLDLPSDSHRTPARASRPDNLTFSTPRPRVFSSCWMSARASRPHILRCYVFTCPTQRVLISGWTPARCSRPDNLTFSVFTCPTQQVLVSRWTPARCSRPDNLTFPVFTCPTKQVLVSRWTPARCSRPDKSYFSCLYLSNTASLNLLLDAGEVLPARQTLFRLFAPKISNPVERDIPGRFGKLSLQSTTGEAPPPSSQVSISPQMPQEPPGWTTSPFPPASAKLTHQTGGHAHQLDVG